MIRAAIYMRVSRPDQTTRSQIGELAAFCQNRGWSVVLEREDVGISGSVKKRPGLDAILEACRRRQVDAVVVYRYDRFARSLQDLVQALNELTDLGIQFVSVHEQLDTTTSMGRLMFGVFASLAEFEREIIRERVRSGIAAARAKGTKSGKAIGRPVAAVDLVKARLLRSQGLGWTLAASTLGVKRTTLRTAMRREYDRRQKEKAA